MTLRHDNDAPATAMPNESGAPAVASNVQPEARMFDFGIIDFRLWQDKLSARDARHRKWQKQRGDAVPEIPKRYYLALRGVKGLRGARKEQRECPKQSYRDPTTYKTVTVFYGREYTDGAWGRYVPDSGWNTWDHWHDRIWALANEAQRTEIADADVKDDAKDMRKTLATLRAGLAGKKDWQGKESRQRYASPNTHRLMTDILRAYEELMGEAVPEEDEEL